MSDFLEKITPIESPLDERPSRALENEGLDVMGMRVILARIPGLTKKGLLNHPFRFQCPPTDSFTRTLAYAHADFDTLYAGQYSRPQGRQLETIQFQTLTVDTDVPFAVWPNTAEFDKTYAPDTFKGDLKRDTVWNVLNMTEELEQIMDSGSPVRLLAGQPALWEGGGQGMGWDVNMPVTLRGIGVSEQAGEVDTRYVDVSFTEYRSLLLERKAKGKAKSKAKKKVDRGHHRPAIVRVFPDSRCFDFNSGRLIHSHITLSRLAKYYYGDPKAWSLIVYANASVFTGIGYDATHHIGYIADRRFNGRPYKLRIPEGFDNTAYLDANDLNTYATLPEALL